MTDINVTWSIVAWIVTVLLIPIIILLYKSESKRVTQQIASKEIADAARHETLAALVTERHQAVMSKLMEYCRNNKGDHEELYRYKNDVVERVKAIETIHHQKGCDQPQRLV